MAAPVPATALSRYTQTFEPSVLGIGSEGVHSNIQNVDDPLYWFVVVNLSDLSVVANVTSASNSEVPTEVQAYADKSGYFLFFIANAQRSMNIPQGALHAFLTAAGAGAGLENAEQLIGQLGTGLLRYFSYILASTLDSGDLPGFEAFSTQGYVTLPMQFVPFDADGRTMYAPSRHTTP